MKILNFTVPRVRMIADYVWIDDEKCLHSKIRILPPDGPDFPDWEYDGSSLGQATISDSEIVLHPCYTVKCPFHREKGMIVLCETCDFQGNPVGSRQSAVDLFCKKEVIDEDPWFGVEQEFFICDKSTGLPIGTPPLTSDIIRTSYCGLGAGNISHRDMVDEFLECAIFSGLSIYGLNSEVSMGQWEYQIGTVHGIEVADQLWIARYIMEKVAERHDIIINLQPKPIQFINGSGCHTNYSTKSTRGNGGLSVIHKYISKLEKMHDKHMHFYGKGNEHRLTGRHETSNYNLFSWGDGSRDTSIRVPKRTVQNGRGYLEDRRPASNMDPYDVIRLICETTLL